MPAVSRPQQAAKTPEQLREELASKGFSLPTAKKPATAAIGKVLIYGAPKSGKSTLLTQTYPDTTIAVDTEGSLVGLEAYVWLDRVLRTWDEFRALGPTLRSTPDHPFDTVGIDTVDVLAQMCSDSVLQNLAGHTRYVHASDFEYGKGWDAVKREFALRVAAVCQVVPNVIFISHADERTKKDRTGLEIETVRSALAPKGVREWLEGFVDHVLYYEVVKTPDGDVHQLRTKISENYLAGGRTPPGRAALPDPIVLPDAETSGAALREALAGVVEAPKNASKAESAESPKKAARGRSAAKKATGVQEQLGGDGA
jgi:hypothetical protein